MSSLLVRSTASSDAARVVEVTPASAGWSHVGFEVVRPRSAIERSATGRETCLVVISGSCTVRSGDQEWPGLGGRETPLAGSPDALYLPSGHPFRVEPLDLDLELAICTAPARPGGRPVRIGADAVTSRRRGRGSFEREIRSILMDEGPAAEVAQSLLVCEVVTPGGHWSSFPPHKHDRDDLPRESLLEETYYHRLFPAEGFGLQRVYTSDGDLDEAIAFADRDTVLVPRGYHVVSAPPGYDLYYLNVMAGPRRAWAIADDPDHAWIAS